MSSNNHKVEVKTMEDVYRWIKSHNEYPTRRAFYDKYGFERGQMLDWILRTKLNWVIYGYRDGGGVTLIPVRVDNPKLKELVEKSVEL